MVFYENCGLQNLYDMVRYCQSKRTCRRNAFFQHFAEPFQDCNGMCDNCAYGNEVEEVDVTCHAKVLISLLQEMQKNEQRTTILQMADKLRIKTKSLVPCLKKEDLENLIVQLIVDRILKEEFQHTAYSTNAYITIGPLWSHVVKDKKATKLVLSGGHGNKSTTTSKKRRGLASGLEVKLDELRKEISSSHGGIFPHSVLSAQQIAMLSSERPTSLNQLEKLIGKLKTDKFGSRIINLIQQFTCSEASGSRDKFFAQDENEEHQEHQEHTNVKRQKKNETLVDIESGEDDDE